MIMLSNLEQIIQQTLKPLTFWKELQSKLSTLIKNK